jgi:hypothetical protein
VVNGLDFWRRFRCCLFVVVRPKQAVEMQFVEMSLLVRREKAVVVVVVGSTTDMLLLLLLHCCCRYYALVGFVTTYCCFSVPWCSSCVHTGKQALSQLFHTLGRCEPMYRTVPYLCIYMAVISSLNDPQGEGVRQSRPETYLGRFGHTIHHRIFSTKI